MTSIEVVSDEPEASFKLDRDGHVLALGGSWTIGESARLDRELKAIKPAGGAIEIDASQVSRMDSAGAWLLLRTRRALEADGGKISRFSLPELYQPLFENLDQERKPEPHKSRIPPGFRGRLYKIGRATMDAYHQAISILGYLGRVTVETGEAIVKPKHNLRIAAMFHQVEETGINALPIVGLLAFLIGIVLAYQGAEFRLTSRWWRTGHPGVDAFAILKDVAHRRLRVPVILVVEWDEKLAIPAFKLGAVDYVVKAADSFRALFFKLDSVPAISPPLEGHAELLEADADLNAAEVASRERLEERLADALATARDTERSLNTATEHFRESQARLQATIDQERTQRETLEAKLAEAEASRQEAERHRALEANTSAAQWLERQGQDAAELARAVARRAALEERVAELESALEHADRRRKLEADLEERLRQEVAARTTLEQDLASAEAARQDLEHTLRSELTAAAAQLAEHRAQHDASVARAAAERAGLRAEARRTRCGAPGSERAAYVGRGGFSRFSRNGRRISRPASRTSPTGVTCSRGS